MGVVAPGERKNTFPIKERDRNNVFFLFTTKFAKRFRHLTVFREIYYIKIDASECYHTVTRTVRLPEDSE